MARILCIDTATQVCSVALFENEKLLSSRETSEGFNHSGKLTVFVQEVLNENSFSVKDLHAVAVSNGPGSYTGLRIGLSVAKGLCFSADIKMISISTLELMAARAITERNEEVLYCPMIDARRMEVYYALYDQHLKCINPPAAFVIDESFLIDKEEKIIFFGDGAEKCKSVLNENFSYAENIFPSARFMGSLALKKFKENIFENISLAEPVYLKEYGERK